MLALALAMAASGCSGDSEPASTDPEGTSTGGAEGASSTGEVATGEASGSDGADSSGGPVEPPEPQTLTVIPGVTFYDGYAEVVDEPVPDGIIRHNNALYATRLTEDELAAIQPALSMDVWIGALCDNYDRIGGVFLSMVPKGEATYVPGEVERYEIARFITPFMNKNKEPTALKYEFDLHNLVPVLTDEALLAEYDMWIELNVFGVPYAANTEVSGCEGRNDVFQGAIELHTDSEVPAESFDFVVPVTARESFNNYQEGASDEVGTTRKTLEFSLPADTEHTQLVLITSNHGANTGGEEYNRREHFVYVDGEQVHMYVPGRDSCEPWRMYNTQGNGIYGTSPRTPEEWQSFSNWCPGDVIDTRIIELGPMTAGTHEFVIDVPDAEFVDAQGDIPLSLYVQGR